MKQKSLILALLVLCTVLVSAKCIAQESDQEKIYTLTEEMPEPPGGIQAFYRYIAENLVYPEEARRKNISGKCYLKFIIDKEGYMKEITVIKGVQHCPECNEAAVEVLRNYRKRWTPGRQNGRAVN